MRQLFTTWLEIERARNGGSTSKAVEKLNAALGLKWNCSRLSEYRQGWYRPRAIVVSWVLAECLPDLLKRAGITVTREQFARLQDEIWVTRQDDSGKRLLELL